MAKSEVETRVTKANGATGTTGLVIPDSLRVELDALSPEEREEVLRALGEDLMGNLKDEEPEFPSVQVLHSAALFEFPDETKVESFEGVIIEILPARAWWEVSNSKERIPPECSSRDWVHPENDSPKPQASSCAKCSWNRWGSAVDPSGEPTRGKACRMRKRIFLQLKDHEIPFILSVSPMSLKSLRTYLIGLSDQGVQKNRTVTSFRLDLQEEGVQKYSVIEFERGADLSLAAYLEARRKREAYLSGMMAVSIGADEFDVIEDQDKEEPGYPFESSTSEAQDMTELGPDGRGSKPLAFSMGEEKPTPKAEKPKAKKDDLPF